MADLAEPSRGGHGGSSPLACVAVVGGSGFYEFLEDAEEIKVDTPFGAPSDPVTVGEVAGRRVAFLPRHGRDHRFPPGARADRARLADPPRRARHAGPARAARGPDHDPGPDLLRPGRLPRAV